MRAISLDSEAEVREFMGVVAREGQKYFWTGGNLRNGHTQVVWPSGASQPVRSLGTYWSHTGG